MEEAHAEQSEETQNSEESGEIFFHPVESSEKSTERSEEKESEASSAEMQRMQDLLKSINEETLQLSEFLVEESKLVSELCISMKHVLEKLHISFNVPPENIPLHKKVKKLFLNEEGRLIIVDEKGEEQSAFLAEYSPEIVMAVLWDVIPQLAKAIMIYRKKLVSRVNFFANLKKELKSMVKTLAGKEEGNQEIENPKR